MAGPNQDAEENNQEGPGAGGGAGRGVEDARVGDGDAGRGAGGARVGAESLRNQQRVQ